MTTNDIQWKQISLPDQVLAVAINVDNVNLTLLGQNRHIYYAKSAEKKEGVYQSLMGRVTWYKGIFNLPYLGSIFNFFDKKPRVLCPEGALFAISHKDDGAHYLDRMGKKFTIGEGAIGSTTTLAIAHLKKRVIHLYDPYIPKWVGDKGITRIPFPETATSTFELIAYDLSEARHIMLGYEVTPSKKGGVEKRLCLSFISADINLIGFNPLEVKYTYSTEDREGRFVLPTDSHHSDLLPFAEEGTFLTGQVHIRAEIIRVAGKKGNLYGYFEKLDTWTFHPQDGFLIPEENLLPWEIHEPEQEFETTVHDYQGEMIQPNLKTKLFHFGENSTQSEIIIEKNNLLLRAELFKRPPQINILGFESFEYTLVIPKETRDVLGENWKEVTPVKMILKNHELLIKAKGTLLFKFSEIMIH